MIIRRAILFGLLIKLTIDHQEWLELGDDLAVIVRLQDLLLQAVEGARDGNLDGEYKAVRRALLESDQYKSLLPRFIKTHRDLPSLWPFFKSYNSSWEPRRKMVRDELIPMMDLAEKNTLYPNLLATDSSAWTGTQSAHERLVAIKTLLPVSMASIESLRFELEGPNHNGGPTLDEHVAAIDLLKKLHGTLGELLKIEDEGRLSSEYGNGLLGQAALYAKRAARELKNDPMPYVVSAMTLAILNAIGAPDIAGYMTGVALNIRRTRTTPPQ